MNHSLISLAVCEPSQKKKVHALLSTYTIDCQYLCITCAVLWDTLNIKRHYIQPAPLLSPVLGFNFYHAVTASYHIYTAGSFPEAWPPHSDHSMALQLPGEKACQALLCAPVPFSSLNGTKELGKSDHSWQAAPDPVPAVGTPHRRGMHHRGKDYWRWKGIGPGFIVTICTWPLEATCDQSKPLLFHLLHGISGRGSCKVLSQHPLLRPQSGLSTGRNPAPSIVEASLVSYISKTAKRYNWY